MTSAELGLNDHYMLWHYDIKMETLNTPASATWSSFMRRISKVSCYIYPFDHGCQTHFTFSKDVQRAGLESWPGRFWPRGFMFDTPAAAGRRLAAAPSTHFIASDLWNCWLSTFIKVFKWYNFKMHKASFQNACTVAACSDMSLNMIYFSLNTFPKDSLRN